MNKALLVLNLVAALVTINILIAEPSVIGHAVAEDDVFTVSKPVKIAVVVIILTLIADVAVYVAELKKKELKELGSSIKNKVEKNVKINFKSEKSKKPEKILRLQTKKKKAKKKIMPKKSTKK
ncbi:MAG: hypothetical protein O2779_00275 [Nanoarchaeota archaeon]|nr:hypothetical protein [Nanoarchaeota archaeon]